MGDTSEHAMGLLMQNAPTSVTMACQLAVHLSDGSAYTQYAAYGGGLLVHAEDKLFHLLEEKYGNLASVPANSKIVFYGNWSPCKLCMSTTVPKKLGELDIINRNQRVRFRFNRYYTAAAWEQQGLGVRKDSGGQYFWDSDEQAQNAYDELARLYGRHNQKDRSTDTQVITTESPRVAFIRGGGSSRIVTEWSEIWRGKFSFA